METQAEAHKGSPRGDRGQNGGGGGQGKWAQRLHAKRVLDFGCGNGRMLEELKKLGIEGHGIDVSKPLVEEARRKGLDVEVGDEKTLEKIPSKSFDVAYTVSVLDHIPNPEPALDQLIRIGKHVVLIEPQTGEERRADEIVKYTYLWNYDKMIKKRPNVQVVHRSKTPLGPRGMGPHYHTWVLRTKERAPEEYDELYRKGYRHSGYEPIYRWIAEWTEEPVADLGCGVGYLAEHLHRKGIKKYRQAKRRVPDYEYILGDIRRHSIDHANTVIMCEILEHIENDQEILERLPPGTKVVGSVPTFMGEWHIRSYRTERDITDRYKMLRFAEIKRIGRHYAFRAVRQ